jgi:peptidoglycan hydrolase-like protein with peptidoglycan-binding domain
MRWLAILLAAAGLGVPAASAAYAATATSASAHPALTLKASGVNGSVGAIISGARWSVSGTVAHYRPGERVRLHAFLDGRPVLSRTTAVRHVGDHGRYSFTLALSGIGRLSVRTLIAATATTPRIVSRTFSLWSVAPVISPGQRSYAVRILQHQLSALHYVVGAPGVYDARTQRAVLAFRKMAGLPLTEVADATVFSAIAAGEGVFTVRYPSQGRHIEADLTHQVLALIGANGVPQRLYPISSGKPSTPTVLGHFAIYLKTPGVNSEGMVDSSYFYTGYAIHGYYSVPTYAASHGCLRCPIPDAAAIYAWATLGTQVDIYYR